MPIELPPRLPGPETFYQNLQAWPTQLALVIITVLAPVTAVVTMQNWETNDAIDAAYDRAVREAVCPNPSIPANVPRIVKEGVFKNIPNYGDLPHGRLTILQEQGKVLIIQDGSNFPKERPLPDCGTVRLARPAAG